MWRPLQLLKKWENSKRGIITGSLGCQNSPICHVKVCYDYISQASPPIDYPTKNCSRQQQGDKFFSLFVYITCYFVIDHLNVIGWLNVDHSVFQKEELWLALIYVCSNCIPFYIIYVSLGQPSTKKWFLGPEMHGPCHKSKEKLGEIRSLLVTLGGTLWVQNFFYLY